MAVKVRLWMSNLGRRFATKSRNVGLFIRYHTNLWRYNSQKALDAFLYGTRQQTSQIPFMVTRNMRKSLSSLGYTEQDVNKMTPSEANHKIKHYKRKCEALKSESSGS